MRLKANRLLAFASMALMGIFAMLAIAAPAHAQTLLDTETKGGITCNKYQAQTNWPQYYWNCDDTVNGGTTTKTDARNITNGAAALPAHLRAGAVGAYEHYLFENATDFAAFTGAPAPAAKSHGSYADPVVTDDGSVTAPIAAVFRHVRQKDANGVEQPITVTPSPGLRVHMAQILGRIYYTKVIVPNVPDVYDHFRAAYNYDAAYVDENPPKGKAIVWPTIYNGYPTLNAWGILDEVYGATPEEVFGYQIGRIASVGATAAALNGALDDMPNTYGIIQY